MLTGLLLLAACATPPFGAPPERLAGAAHAGTTGGEEARSVLERMHGRDVAPVESSIHRYAGPTFEVLLYVSDFTDGGAARDVERRMLEAMAGGRGPFTDPRVRRIEGRRVAVCDGMGQRHLIVRAGSSVLWLAADPAVFDAAARELVQALR